METALLPASPRSEKSTLVVVADVGSALSDTATSPLCPHRMHSLWLPSMTLSHVGRAEDNEQPLPLEATTPTEAAAPGVAATDPAAVVEAPGPALADASGTSTVPVDFTVPQGQVACVAPGKLMQVQGAINVDPPSVGFGEVDPEEWQANVAALRLTNSGQTQQTITHISCAPLDNMSAATIPFFVIQFGDGADAARVKYV